MEFKKEIQESLKDYFKSNFGVDIANISISQINPDFRYLGDYAFNFNALRKIAKMCIRDRPWSARYHVSIYSLR